MKARISRRLRARGRPASRGLDFYAGGPSAIPSWENSLLARGMTRGRVYRLKLTADGLRVSGEALEYFQTPNRYRDIAIHPDQRTFYFSTDTQGRTTKLPTACIRLRDIRITA